jgi:hypothetical protein
MINSRTGSGTARSLQIGPSAPSGASPIAAIRATAIHRACLVVLALGLAGSALAQSANVSVYATGLNNPRGLKFGPDGYLYVAEGGAGGALSTVSDPSVTQVPFPVGPYTGGFTSRISKVKPDGTLVTVVDGLPSSQTAPTQGSLVSGAADVAFIGRKMYVILAGAGPSHGLANTFNAVLRIRKNGGVDIVADLSAYQQAHPVANPEPDDFEPDGTWYSMLAVDDDLYAVEPNHGELDKIDPENGHIKRVADISASQGHIVPTALAYDGDDFYVSNLNPFPIVDGSSRILKISKSGHVSIVATGFTTVLGLAFDCQHRLYILENTTGNPFPTPGTGKVVRLDRNGAVDEIATGLFLPTGMTMGPDGNLYVSNVGFGPPPVGLGQVVKITLPSDSACAPHRH